MVSLIPWRGTSVCRPRGVALNLGFQKQLLDVSQPSWCEVSSERAMSQLLGAGLLGWAARVSWRRPFGAATGARPEPSWETGARGRASHGGRREGRCFRGGTGEADPAHHTRPRPPTAWPRPAGRGRAASPLRAPAFWAAGRAR